MLSDGLSIKSFWARGPEHVRSIQGKEKFPFAPPPPFHCTCRVATSVARTFVCVLKA